MGLSFSRPEFLLLLPVAAALLWYSARVSYADLSGSRRWFAWTVRALITLALILALSGAQLVKRSKEMVAVFAVDASYSVPQEERGRALKFVQESLKHLPEGDRGILVFFGRDATVETEVLRRPEDVRMASTPAPTHTNIAAAIRLALGLIPPESAGKVVLLSDGNENVGSAEEEVLLAQAKRIPLEVVPLRTRTAKDVLVRKVSVPQEARLGEPFPILVTLEATQPAQATVTILVDDKPVERQAVTLAAGDTGLRIPISLPDAGFHKIDVLVENPDDECRENNLGTGFVRVQGEPRVLVVEGGAHEADSLRQALQLQGIKVEVGGPVALPTSAADLEKYDSVFLSNLPAYKMDGRQMAMLRNATRDLGIGLGMIGGEFSFGAGGYYQTPVEEALPVSMDIRKNRAFPASAVLIVMDTSGSMGMPEEGVEKIQLAAEAACAVVDLLQPYDSVGFIASDPTPTLVCKLRKIENKAQVKSDIRSVRAGGGGIAVNPSLSAAYDVLRKEWSPVRHVILLADGSDCDEQEGSVPLAARMASEKITVTAVAFGDGPHVPFLKDVSKAGQGQFYLTEKASDLKKIFTRETLMMARSVLVEEPFKPRLADVSDVVQGVDWSSVPPLLGYVATSAKQLACVPLVSHKDDPVFAHWQYGLGRSIAFTSDTKAHWAAYWLGWQGFPKFWGQTVRWSLRQTSSGVLHPQVEPEGEKAHIVVDAATEDGTWLNGLEIRANVNLPDGTRQEVVLGQTASGRYESTLDATERGAYVMGLVATGPGGFKTQQTAGFAVAYPPDFADTRMNGAFLESLAEQTGGKVLTRPENVFAPPAVVPRTLVDIWRSLLWLAALLLPLDVAVRRLALRREDLALFMQPLRSAAKRLRPAEVGQPAIASHLLALKKLKRERAVAQPPPLFTEQQRKPEPSPQLPRATQSKPSAGQEAMDTTTRLLEQKRRLKGHQK
jgi:uncharacterized membrane protein